MSPLAGRDWKLYPLTVDEVRLMRQRTREERAQDWQDFKRTWPMDVLGLLADLGFGTLLGVALSLSLFLWALSEAAL